MSRVAIDFDRLPYIAVRICSEEALGLLFRLVFALVRFKDNPGKFKGQSGPWTVKQILDAYSACGSEGYDLFQELLAHKLLEIDEDGTIVFPPLLVKNAGRVRETIPRDLNADVLSAGACAQCGSTEQLTVDHRIPWSKGGTNDIGNLQCLCWPCNQAKGTKLPSATQ